MALAAGGGPHHPALTHHFPNLAEQKEASSLGMWLFIAQEIMFFGGLFLAYTVYRNLYPAAFAEASHHLNWKLGGINTAVLIGSSLTMALAVHAAVLGHRLDPDLLVEGPDEPPADPRRDGEVRQALQALKSGVPAAGARRIIRYRP